MSHLPLSSSPKSAGPASLSCQDTADSGQWAPAGQGPVSMDALARWSKTVESAASKWASIEAWSAWSWRKAALLGTSWKIQELSALEAEEETGKSSWGPSFLESKGVHFFSGWSGLQSLSFSKMLSTMPIGIRLEAITCSRKFWKSGWRCQAWNHQSSWSFYYITARWYHAWYPEYPPLVHGIKKKKKNMLFDAARPHELGIPSPIPSGSWLGSASHRRRPWRRAKLVWEGCGLVQKYGIPRFDSWSSLIITWSSLIMTDHQPPIIISPIEIANRGIRHVWTKQLNRPSSTIVTGDTAF